MAARHALIRGALDALALSRAFRFLPQPREAAGFVVTLHHVRPASAAEFQPNALLAVTPDFLDRWVTHAIAKGWSFVSVDELCGGGGGTKRARRIAVTLDDGYRNNLEHALPVFRRHGVPFTIFVCPGFSDRTSELWWEALERIIASAETIPLDGDGPAESTPARSLVEKNAAFVRWREWLIADADEARQRHAIRALAEKYGLDLAALARELVMDWDEIRTIAADPLCTIGAHTMTHPALARLPQNEAFREMQESAERIASEIGKRPTTIAFPYGYAAAAGAREASLAEQAGFSASFTTRPGYVRRDGSPHGLPRVSVNGLFQKERYLDVLLTPGLWNLRDNLRRPS